MRSRVRRSLHSIAFRSATPRQIWLDNYLEGNTAELGPRAWQLSRLQHAIRHATIATCQSVDEQEFEHAIGNIKAERLRRVVADAFRRRGSFAAVCVMFGPDPFSEAVTRW